MENPHVYTGYVFKDALAKAGIVFKGKVEARKTPQDASVLGVHDSRPLSHIVEEMVKHSDNLYADCLFKKVGEHRFGAPGTWQKGSQAVRAFLRDTLKMDTDKMVILDGSGLSRYNLISAREFVEFLGWMHKQFDCSSEFMASLAIGGVDGTLMGRLTEENQKGRVRAKTGFMTGISSLTGYLTTRNGEVLAFAILQNGFTGEAEKYKREVEDAICSFLMNYNEKK